jgi:hypothetical protein
MFSFMLKGWATFLFIKKQIKGFSWVAKSEEK